MRTFGEKISASADADQVAEAGVRIRDRGLVGIGALARRLRASSWKPC